MIRLKDKVYQYDSEIELEFSNLKLSEQYAHFQSESGATCSVDSTSFSENITVDDAKFISKMGVANASYTFTYNSLLGWTYGGKQVTIGTYGITTTATPSANDTIVINETNIVSVEIEDNKCVIPNQFLRFAGNILVMVYCTDDDACKTTESMIIPVTSRPCPPEYVINPTPVITYPALVDLVADLTALKAILSVWSATIDNNVGTPSVEVSMTSSGTALAFHNLKGNGITSVAKTSTSGLTDTYTITFANGTTTTFTVTNGKGISSIAKTGTSGLVDTYTITYNDATTSTFTVTNGAKGDAATIAVGTTTTGEPGTSASVVNSGTSSAAVFDFTIPKGSKGDKGDDGFSGDTASFDTDDSLLIETGTGLVGHLYEHIVFLSSTYIKAYLVLYTSSATAFTASTLESFFVAHEGKDFPFFGTYINDDESFLYPAATIIKYRSQANVRVLFRKAQQEYHSVQLSTVFSSDTVIQIL